MRRITAAFVCAALATALLATAASADQKTGCPAGQGFTDPTSVADAANAIYPILLDSSAFPSVDDLAADLAGYDRNGDEMLCLKWMWGDALNPNSHWYKVGVDVLGAPAVQVFAYDNNSAAP